MPTRKIHLTNAAKRDATVAMESVKPPAGSRLGLPGREVRFLRYVATADSGLHPSLEARFGDRYHEALIEGDPEIDLELVGRAVEETDRVYLSSKGEVLYVEPRVTEVIYGPDGEERTRRDPQVAEANVNDETPIRWTGRKMPKAEAVRRFAFRRTVQIRHVDGVTFDFLFQMAKELHEEKVVVRLTGGEDGKSPLRFVRDGSPYQGFLEGRVDESEGGQRYQLLLHLSNMELKRPDEGA